ncbi:MAG: TIGR02253 family HAD-type hydrolase [archaeon]
MIKAVLFDLDNTLIDFMTMKRKSCEAAINAMIDSGLKLKKEKAIEILFDLFKSHGIEDQTIFQKFLKKTVGGIDYKILAKGIAAYRRKQVGYLMPYPDVESTLKELRKKGLKLGIVSDAPKLKAWLRLAEMDLTDYFDLVIALDDTGKRKPHLLPFDTAIKRLGLKAEEIMFVGDNPKRDIFGAKKAGMKTCLAKYGQLYPSKGIKADFEVKGVKELLKIL